MTVLALSGAIWLAFAIVVVFMLALILRWTFGLVAEVKGLARELKAANGALKDAQRDVTEGARLASERMSHISRERAGRRIPKASRAGDGRGSRERGVR